jgi:sirohydrochlorin ferrochelatase
VTSTLLAVSHGTADARGQAAVQRLVDAVRMRLVDVDVRQAFVDVQQPSLGSVLRSLDGPVTVVPLLLGAGFHVHIDIAEAVRARFGGFTSTAGTLGPDAALTGLLADRLHHAGLAEADAVVLAVAGSSDIRARLGADRAAAMLSARLRRRVRVGHLGGSGRTLTAAVDEARAGLSANGRVLAANYLLAPGYFNDRLHAGSADIVTGPLAGGVHLDDRLVDLVIRRFRAASQRRLALLG